MRAGNIVSIVGMAQQGLSISTASACDFVNTQPSHVIKAISVPQDYAKGTIRISLGKGNTEEGQYDCRCHCQYPCHLSCHRLDTPLLIPFGAKKEGACTTRLFQWYLYSAFVSLERGELVRKLCFRISQLLTSTILQIILHLCL